MKPALAVLSLAVLALFLIRPAQTVGVEAWHDSAVPAGDFVAITPGATLEVRVQAVSSALTYSPPAEPRSQPARPSPSLRAVPGNAHRLAASASQAESVTGLASTYGPGYDGYLALPAGPDIHVRICGAGGCIDRVSNDEGPVPSLHRVADLSVADFEKVCGVPWTRGLCRVEVTIRW